MSVHDPNEARWSMQSEWYGVNRPNQPNQLRHIEKWTWTPIPQPSPVEVFRVFIPESELRTVHTDENVTTVNWVAAPPQGHRVHAAGSLNGPSDGR